MKNKILNFIQEEKVTFFNLLNPFFIFKLCLKHRFIHFLFIGISNFILHLTLTWFFTRFFFGLEKYYYAYLLSLFIVIIYSFIMHTLITFKTKTNHKKRFFLFFINIIILSILQALIVFILSKFFIEKYYLIILTFSIIFTSIISFILYKFKIFKN